MFFKIGSLKNFAIDKEKHLCWSFFLMKLQAVVGVSEAATEDVYKKVVVKNSAISTGNTCVGVSF